MRTTSSLAHPPNLRVSHPPPPPPHLIPPPTLPLPTTTTTTTRPALYSPEPPPPTTTPDSVAYLFAPGRAGSRPPPQVGRLNLPARAGDCTRANEARRSAACGIPRSARPRRIAVVAPASCAAKRASARSAASCRSGTGSSAGCRSCPFPTRRGQRR